MPNAASSGDRSAVSLRRESRTRDLAMGLAIAAGSALYLFLLPHHLGEADESYFLYHAKRVLDGQLPYRDFYELHMTLPYYAMAAVFRLFGLDVTTAAAASAVVQGLIAWAVFATARALGAGVGFALVAGIAQPALLSLTWPYGSPHWIATLLLLVLMRFVCRPGERGVGRWFTTGVLVGVLGVAQHQNAAVVATALLVLLVLDDRLVGPSLSAPHGVDRRPAGPAVRQRLVAYVAGCALVPVPYLLAHIALAGWWDVVDQVFLYPFQGYSRQVQAPAWGSVTLFTAGYRRFTIAPLVTWTPVLLPVALARAVAARRRGDRATTWRLVAAAVVAATASVSTLYHPDFIHVAFMAPLYVPLAAEGAEAAVAVARRRWPGPGTSLIAPAVTTVLLVLLAVQLGLNVRRLDVEFARTVDTPFGRLAVRMPWAAEQVEMILAVERARGTTELFAYPMFPFLFLTTGTDNPSRHDALMERLSRPEDYREVTAVLDARPETLVHVNPLLIAPHGDPFLEWLTRRGYRCIQPGRPADAPPGPECLLLAHPDAAS